MNKNYKHIFFIGIGGISMSGLAELCLVNGIKVSGSDINKSSLIEKLKKDGATIYMGHSENNICEDVDLMVYTSAINDCNSEYKRAVQMGIDIKSRAEFLGEIMKEHKNSIAVSGTHGKTTTTGMLASILIKSDLDSTIFLGGELGIIEGNIKIGNGELLLTEACEYRRNFLKFSPTVGIVLNVEEDHLDYYNGISDIELAFKQFAQLLPKRGTLIANNCNKNLFEGTEAELVTFGLEDGADIYAENIKYLPEPKFDIVYNGDNIGELKLKVYGEHNILNSLAAFGAAKAVGINDSVILEGLREFVGTERRFEIKGEYKGIIVIDDYAHHPTEIKMSLTTARGMCSGKIITVFQPHTYTRTKELFCEFAKVFELTDEIIIIDIYAAREPDTGLVSSKELVEETKKYNKNAIYANSFQNAVEKALEKASEGDMIIAMGAGSIGKMPEMLIKGIEVRK